MYPKAEVAFDFDDKCLKKEELIFSEGLPHENHHVVYNQVKAMIDGQDPIYIPIDNHREVVSWSKVKEKVSRMPSDKVFRPPAESLDTL